MCCLLRHSATKGGGWAYLQFPQSARDANAAYYTRLPCFTIALRLFIFHDKFPLTFPVATQNYTPSTTFAASAETDYHRLTDLRRQMYQTSVYIKTTNKPTRRNKTITKEINRLPVKRHFLSSFVSRL